MNRTVVIVEEAEAHLAEAVAWWSERSPSQAALLLDEFEQTLALLTVVPDIGHRFTRARKPGVRRVLLRRFQRYIYYFHDSRRSVIYVLALWSTSRGEDPPISSSTRRARR